MAVCWDPLISERESEKTAKHQDLAIDMGRRYRGWKVQVLPIVMGALGTVDNCHGCTRNSG